MKPIEELLQNLARPEVLEFGLVTNRLPSVNVGGRFEPVDTEAPTTEKLVAMLVAMGGARYVDSLSDKPVQWTTRLDGVGVIAIAAIMRRDVVQARFTVAKREPPLHARPSVPAKPPPPPLPSGPPPPPPPKSVPAQRAAPPARPSAPGQSVAPPAPPSRVPDSSGTLVASPAPPTNVVTSAPKVVVPPAPPDEEWDDDDEPTVQTSSPPVRLPKIDSGLPVPSPVASTEPPAETAKPAERPAEREDVPESRPMPRRRETPTSVDAQRVEEELAARKSPGTITTPHTPASTTKPEPASERPPARESRPPLDVTTLEALLALARSSSATDVHVTSGRPVAVRVGRELVARTRPVPPEALDAILAELLAPAELAGLENEGACEVVLERADHGRFRARVTKHLGGRHLHLRAGPTEAPTLAGLGVPEPVGALVRAPRGLLLLASPAGEGRSSTAAALLDAAANGARRIVVVAEAPLHPLPSRSAIVTRHELGGDVASLAEAVSLAIDVDADVVVLDVDGAPITCAAIELAEAGKLVIATIAATSAASAVERLLGAVAPDRRAGTAERLARALRAVVGQRLVPNADRTRLHAAFELVPSSVPLYAAVREGRPGAVAAMLARGRQPGGLTLEDALGDLVRAGRTTHDLARAYAARPDDLEAPARADAPASGS